MSGKLIKFNRLIHQLVRLNQARKKSRMVIPATAQVMLLPSQAQPHPHPHLLISASMPIILTRMIAVKQSTGPQKDMCPALGNKMVLVSKNVAHAGHLLP